MALTAASLLIAPGTAQAAPTARAYAGECGSGFVQIDSFPLSTGATVYLTYSSATGNNCVITKRDTVGTAQLVGAAIRRAGDPASEDIDSGNYTSYAGPVYVNAPGSCIDWGGEYLDDLQQRFNDHCGFKK
ncbi:spore-associated protein A [Streptomyces sp. NBC_01498]|uniref:spore-associated protein A n=1 Tax=Streptomyces sp. NBC_01498 TaxID=2975870 RepID=UPI002E7B63B4|nr:spore-associated protein A [Streptomyces sp. NBC_01498]WTL25021.1 spore-associated protein A [Streptomyces sp. NBC_01498]